MRKSTLDEAAFHEPTRTPLAAGIPYSVTLIVSVKPSVGIGPITAPSVQHVAHRHVPDPVPAPLFHWTSRIIGLYQFGCW